MITRVIEIDGEAYVILPGGDLCKRAELYGKSTDTKPVNSVNNSDIFYEMDTKKVFLFDAQNKQWLEQ
jgi:hypothetical protein